MHRQETISFSPQNAPDTSSNNLFLFSSHLLNQFAANVCQVANVDGSGNLGLSNPQPKPFHQSASTNSDVASIVTNLQPASLSGVSLERHVNASSPSLSHWLPGIQHHASMNSPFLFSNRPTRLSSAKEGFQQPAQAVVGKIDSFPLLPHHLQIQSSPTSYLGSTELTKMAFEPTESASLEDTSGHTERNNEVCLEGRDHLGATNKSKVEGLHVVQIYLDTDEEALTPYQCLLRKQIELFEACRNDIRGNAQGRNTPIMLGQVGIRCRHCASLPQAARARGSTYYSQTIDGIYQVAQNMSKIHLCEHCHRVPADLRNQLNTLRAVHQRANGGKVYWANGIRALGVIEHGRTLRFRWSVTKSKAQAKELLAKQYNDTESNQNTWSQIFAFIAQLHQITLGYYRWVGWPEYFSPWLAKTVARLIENTGQSTRCRAVTLAAFQVEGIGRGYHQYLYSSGSYRAIRSVASITIHFLNAQARKNLEAIKNGTPIDKWNISLASRGLMMVVRPRAWHQFYLFVWWLTSPAAR